MPDFRQVAAGQDCEEARRHGLTAAHGLGEAARMPPIRSPRGYRCCEALARLKRTLLPRVP